MSVLAALGFEWLRVSLFFFPTVSSTISCPFVLTGRLISASFLSAISFSASDTIAVFYFSPIIISFGIANYRTVSKEILDNINIAITILLSVFFVMIDLIENKTVGQNRESNYVSNQSEQNFEKVKKETIDIILVDSIYSVLYLFISFLIQFIGTDNKELSVLLYIISIIVYSIVLIVVIHLLIILKRFRIILNYQ